MNISVIIPAYNEEKRIEPSLKKIIAYLEKNFKEYEILIVDDCSVDNTAQIITAYQAQNIKVLRNDTNRGKGYSVKRGIMNATHPLVLYSDSDLATPIEELAGFVPYIADQNYDAVIASRNLESSDIKNKQPVYRQVMGKIFPRIVRLLTVQGFSDTQCGFKLFKTDVARKIVELQTIDGFSFDVEMLLIARNLHYRVKEAPVVWVDKEGSTVRTIRDGLRMLGDLFRIKYNDLAGAYCVRKG